MHTAVQLFTTDSRNRGEAVKTRITEIADGIFRHSRLTSGKGATTRSLVELAPRRPALTRGPSFAGNGAVAPMAPADDCDRRAASFAQSSS